MVVENANMLFVDVNGLEWMVVTSTNFGVRGVYKYLILVVYI
jgi:hypothetical protein